MARKPRNFDHIPLRPKIKRAGHPIPVSTPSWDKEKERNSELGDRAFNAVQAQLKYIEIKDAALAELPISLATIAYWYVTERQHDKSPTFGEIKDEIKVISRKIEQLIEAMSGVSQSARAALTNACPRTIEEPSYVLKMISDLQDFQNYCNRLIIEEFTKGKKIAMPGLCERLVLLWEELSKRKFPHNLDYCETKGVFTFTAPGALFVQVAAQAIDKDITFRSLEERLQNFLKERAKVGRRRRKMVEFDDNGS